MKYTIVLMKRFQGYVTFRLYVNGELTNTGTNSNLCMHVDEFEDFKQRLNAEVK